MTYRELIEICIKTPAEECWECTYKKECKVFMDTVDKFPVFLFDESFYKEENIDFDAEIEVIE